MSKLQNSGSRSGLPCLCWPCQCCACSDEVAGLRRDVRLNVSPLTMAYIVGHESQWTVQDQY
ncbi:hypothetical protein [Escherichia coli]|uniref:hypothetical protein n=1 Tax=Escherichia coli TaxID=562 RepID=UPI001F25E3AD|nr:hypothetical protein [Escherichia coli]